MLLTKRLKHADIVGRRGLEDFKHHGHLVAIALGQPGMCPTAFPEMGNDSVTFNFRRHHGHSGGARSTGPFHDCQCRRRGKKRLFGHDNDIICGNMSSTITVSGGTGFTMFAIRISPLANARSDAPV